LYGENTDWIAIRNLVSNNLQQSIVSSSTSLVIGAGGTTRAAIYALHALGIPTIYLYNRTKASALGLIDSFPSSYNIQVLDSLNSFPSNPPIVVVSTVPASATSLQDEEPTNPGDTIVLSSAILASKRGGVVVDMAYKPAKTPLLALTKRDERRLWKAISGVEILIEQGCKQFELWTSRRAPKSIIEEAVLRAYNE
jgi:pentafunctional AROM polypeptide